MIWYIYDIAYHYANYIINIYLILSCGFIYSQLTHLSWPSRPLLPRKIYFKNSKLTAPSLLTSFWNQRETVWSPPPCTLSRSDALRCMLGVHFKEIDHVTFGGGKTAQCLRVSLQWQEAWLHHFIHGQVIYTHLVLLSSSIKQKIIH